MWEDLEVIIRVGYLDVPKEDKEKIVSIGEEILGDPIITNQMVFPINIIIIEWRVDPNSNGGKYQSWRDIYKSQTQTPRNTGYKRNIEKEEMMQREEKTESEKENIRGRDL